MYWALTMCQALSQEHLMYSLTASSQQPWEGDPIAIPISLVEKLRNRDVRSLAPGHIAGKVGICSGAAWLRACTPHHYVICHSLCLEFQLSNSSFKNTLS